MTSISRVNEELCENLLVPRVGKGEQGAGLCVELGVGPSAEVPPVGLQWVTTLHVL